jgi:DNA-directed RNA polymerase subunit RPC12/RpoP
MPISLTCPSCDRKLNAPDQAAGRMVKCPKCGQRLTVPSNVEEIKLAPVSPFRPDTMTLAETEAEAIAAAMLLEGEKPLPTVNLTAPDAKAAQGDEPTNGSARELNSHAPQSIYPAEKPATAGMSKRILALVVYGVAASVLLAGGLWVWSYSASINRKAADIEQQAKQVAAERQADEERLRNTQLAASQQLAQKRAVAERQVRDMQERSRNEAYRMASQLGQERQKIEGAKAALQNEREAKAQQERIQQEVARRQAAQQEQADQAALAAFLVQRQRLSDAAKDRIQEYRLSSKSDPGRRYLPVEDTWAKLNKLHAAFKTNKVELIGYYMKYLLHPYHSNMAIRLLDVGGDYIPPETPNMETLNDAWNAGLKLVQDP